ncbi:pantothenate kinase 1-like [Pyrus x bretschneideri]|uniref:pantothenate kinase 1-like n=1 Tax=Pyrus x bretschneideri TaxID=225117 RepID=UPI0020308405|nr:pantothenate kinase 1-like [Pyrus x bretschneideri]
MISGSQQHGASGSTTCIIKATGGGAFKYADLFKEKLGISLDKADEMDCLVVGANFLLKAAADDQIQVIEMIKLLETRGSKTF